MARILRESDVASRAGRSTGYRVGRSAPSLAVIGLVAFLLVSVASAPAASLAGSPSVIRAASVPQAPTPRNLTFYMHNATIGKDVNAVTTPYTFDTWQAFGKNNTVSKIQQVQQDWYLFPVLAGNLTVNGTIAAHVFVSIDLVGAQITPSLTVSERNRSGGVIPVFTFTYGSQGWWTSPHDLVLASTPIRYTFAAGSSILIVVKITSGVRTATIWYNASWVPTHVVIQSDDFARIDSLAFLDSTGTSRTTFDPLAANKNIDVRVNVSDPLGSYDVHWANLTLQRPGGAFVFSDRALTEIAGTPVSYESTFDLVWNYSGQPVGRYNATASVLDNSGYYYFTEFFAEDGFRAALASSFYIGGLPHYVNLEAVDSKGVPLSGATVILLTGGVKVDATATDAGGLANLTMAGGTYEFRVFWEGVLVASVTRNVQSNVSAASPLVITTEVYYPVFQATDADGRPLADATLIFVHPNGTKLGPYKTNASGEVALDQVPVGTYGLTASWRGVDVFSGPEVVNSNGVIAFATQVYELTVVAKAGDGSSLAGVFVSVTDSTGLVFDAGVTGSNGMVILRLPAGTYTVNARYVASYLGSFYDSGVRTSSVTLTSSTSTTVTFGDYPIPIASTLEFQFAVAYAVTVAALLIVFFLLWRRKTSPSVSAPEAPKKKHGPLSFLFRRK